MKMSTQGTARLQRPAVCTYELVQQPPCWDRALAWARHEFTVQRLRLGLKAVYCKVVRNANDVLWACLTFQGVCSRCDFGRVHADCECVKMTLYSKACSQCTWVDVPLCFQKQSAEECSITSLQHLKHGVLPVELCSERQGQWGSTFYVCPAVIDSSSDNSRI